MKTRRFLLVLIILVPVVGGIGLQADDRFVREPNYELASRWTNAKVGRLVFDTAVTPHWLEFSDRFWYSYETRDGKRYFLVDPGAAALKGGRVKAPLFDNAKMAAMLTMLTRVPMDAQHLPIKSLKFIKRDAVVLLEVEVPKDAEIPGAAKPAPRTTSQDGQDGREAQDGQDGQDGTTGTTGAPAATLHRGQAAPRRSVSVSSRWGWGPSASAKEDGNLPQEADKDEEGGKTKSVYFEYELAASRLTLVDEADVPAKKPRWASVSPDDSMVVFARGQNLFMMDTANYARAQKNPGDSSVVETQITTDGEQHFGYARRLNDEDRKVLKKDQKGDNHKMGPRVPSIVVNWSRDSKKFAVVRRDERKVSDLWVINSLSNPRPTLETYRYAMPGESQRPSAADRNLRRRDEGSAAREGGTLQGPGARHPAGGGVGGPARKGKDRAAVGERYLGQALFHAVQP